MAGFSFPCFCDWQGSLPFWIAPTTWIAPITGPLPARQQALQELLELRKAGPRTYYKATAIHRQAAKRLSLTPQITGLRRVTWIWKFDADRRSGRVDCGLSRAG